MNWRQVTFVVDAAQVDDLSAVLERFSAQAITSKNAGENEFYEVAFPGIPDWQRVAVTGLFEATIELDPIIELVQAQLGPENGSEFPISTEELADQDWQRVWLSSFKPIRVGAALWVCPSWCKPSQPNERNIILDPGLAFGTGTHATTGMCLEWLADQQLHGKTVLDYGCGSGILAIAALFSGASQADAVDIDPLAVNACQENAERNCVAHKMTTYLPFELKSDKYDLVIANILTEVIIELRDTLLLHLASNGDLLLTGILSSQASRVIDAFGIRFDFETHTRDQWSLLICTQSR